MSDERDKRLLEEFCAWLRREGIKFHQRDEAGMDAGRVLWFLHSRCQPQACNRHGLTDCAVCHGGSSPEMESTPPAPQRFWTVDQTVTGGHWRAYETDASGKIMLGFQRLWDNRWQAEADGAASGLPPWKPIP